MIGAVHTPGSSNPYQNDTPEWQIFERVRSSELTAIAFDRDAEKMARQAAAKRTEADNFDAALVKLTGKSARAAIAKATQP